MERKLIILLSIPFFLFWHWFEPAARKNREGLKAYQQGKYDEALKDFLSAKGIKPDLPELKNNTASALYQVKKYQEALEEFSKIDPAKAKIPSGDFYYNLGNSFFRLNQFDKALESYKKSLISNPGDMDAKKNFELTLKKKQEQQQKQNQDQDKKQDQQQQQQQQEEKEKKHENIMQYLNQNEKEQMEKQKRKVTIVVKEKDW